MRFFRSRSLSVFALALFSSTLFGSAIAVPWAVAGDGSATDDAIPSAWVGAPTAPKATPCNFAITRLTPWKVQGDTKTSYCSADGIGLSPLACVVADHCESYSNAVLLGSEIWGYTWADDSQGCYYDECSSADTVGYSTEMVIYTLNPSAGCSATISGRLDQQFLWRVVGRGNVEVEVAGLMRCQPADLNFPCTTISGGKAAYVGSRCGCAPKVASGKLTIGKGPLSITIPFSALDSDTLPFEEEVVGFAGVNVAAAIPLGIVGEIVTMKGYCKVRSYADEPGVGNADVQGWIRDADPGLTIMLSCQGRPHCKLATTSTCKRPAKGK